MNVLNRRKVEQSAIVSVVAIFADVDAFLSDFRQNDDTNKQFLQVFTDFLESIKICAVTLQSHFLKI